LIGHEMVVFDDEYMLAAQQVQVSCQFKFIPAGGTGSP
jgi:hypothetical protein